MNASVTPPRQTLKQKVKVRPGSAAGIDREEAIAAGEAVLEVRLDAARSELQRLLHLLAADRNAPPPVESDRHPLLAGARAVADTAGTFGFVAMTLVGRSLEGYLMAIKGHGVSPDPRLTDLHVEALNTLLAKDVRGDIGPGEGQLLDGLRKVVERSLSKAGLLRPAP